MADLNYLLLVVEEAAEVIHRAMKLARFGADDIDPTGQHKGKTALQALAEEVGDLYEVLDRFELPQEHIETGRRNKRTKLLTYGLREWAQKKKSRGNRMNPQIEKLVKIIVEAQDIINIIRAACSHEKYEIVQRAWAPGHYNILRVCLSCNGAVKGITLTETEKFLKDQRRSKEPNN